MLKYIIYNMFEMGTRFFSISSTEQLGKMLSLQNKYSFFNNFEKYIYIIYILLKTGFTYISHLKYR